MQDQIACDVDDALLVIEDRLKLAFLFTIILGINEIIVEPPIAVARLQDGCQGDGTNCARSRHCADCSPPSP